MGSPSVVSVARPERSATWPLGDLGCWPSQWMRAWSWPPRFVAMSSGTKRESVSRGYPAAIRSKTAPARSGTRRGRVPVKGIDAMASTDSPGASGIGPSGEQSGVAAAVVAIAHERRRSRPLSLRMTTWMRARADGAT